MGGNGFIGSHLVDRLLQEHWDVTVLDLQARRFGPLPHGINFIHGDLSKGYLLREALAGVDIVYHLAWATIHEVSNRDPAADVEANLVPTLRLLETCRELGVGRFVFVSSGGTVYGRTREVPIAETHPLEPVNSYGIGKLAVEKYLEMFHQLYGLDYVILRPSVPYGPRQNPLARQGAVPVFLYRVSHQMPVMIWGDGSITRDFFYISDLSDAFMAVAGRDFATCPRVYNIGGGREVALRALVTAVERTVGRDAHIEHLPERRFDAPRILLDISRAQHFLDWQPRVPLEDGLAQTWAWMTRVLPQ